MRGLKAKVDGVIRKLGPILHTLFPTKSKQWQSHVNKGRLQSILYLIVFYLGNEPINLYSETFYFWPTSKNQSDNVSIYCYIWLKGSQQIALNLTSGSFWSFWIPKWFPLAQLCPFLWCKSQENKGSVQPLFTIPIHKCYVFQGKYTYTYIFKPLIAA